MIKSKNEALNEGGTIPLKYPTIFINNKFYFFFGPIFSLKSPERFITTKI